MEVMQRRLSADQLAAFYSDQLTSTQADHFRALTKDISISGVVVDVGGGCGHFANMLRLSTELRVRVIDTDTKSVETCVASGVDAVVGDALNPSPAGDEAVACFNLMLHHLVGDTEASTRRMQIQALAAWRDKADYVFVNEYVYESFLGDVSGRIIYAVTSSKLLSAIAGVVGRFVRSLRANTLGVGVRFRSENSWLRVFDSAGYVLLGSMNGPDEPLPLPRRLLLIRSKRRNSYLLIQKDRARGDWP